MARLRLNCKSAALRTDQNPEKTNEKNSFDDAIAAL
jgi:hypothetical protein